MNPTFNDSSMKMTPEVTTRERIYEHEGYQALQPVQRPPYWGVDLDPSRRPGQPREKSPPAPFPNTRYPPEQQQGEPSVPMHGRPNKKRVPVFGTAVPLKGLSGVVRRMAYQLPDHSPNHWLLKLLGDRIDSLEHRVKKYSPFILPFTAAAVIVRVLRGSSDERSAQRRSWVARNLRAVMH